jgi:hypothetical protein
VLFSCKISHSILTYLDRRGEDLDDLHAQADIPPAEFLKDPSYWLEAERMEALLKTLKETYAPAVGENLIQEVGHQCKELRSWGVLDSVLRMVQSPYDIYSQPARFLSYFISPAPPVGDVRKTAEAIEFAIPVSKTQYPLTVEYLTAALEALPTYATKPMAVVKWCESLVQVKWTDHQESLFGEEQNSKLSLGPELLQNIVRDLENSQKHLEDSKRQNLLKEQESEALRDQLAQAVSQLASRGATADLAGPPASHIKELVQSIETDIGLATRDVLSDVYRLHDYLTRASQLITLLVGQERKTPQVQEAMRRVDWLRIQGEVPQVVQHSLASLQQIQSRIEELTKESCQMNSAGIRSKIKTVDSRRSKDLPLGPELGQLN